LPLDLILDDETSRFGPGTTLETSCDGIGRPRAVMKVGMSSDASYGVHHALILGAILRLILLVWGTYQDANSAVKYTDIDYTVISAAARCVVLPTSPSCTTSDGPLHLAAVGDPYARDTYRYTPLLALMVTLNIVVHASFGKVLFALADLVVGGLLYRLLLSRGSTRRSATIITSAVWILNPIIANISTRGSAESILGVMVVSTLALAEAGRWDAAAIVFGLAVHFKIYPVIYGSSLFVKLGNGRGITRDHWRFGMIALATFASLNAVMYAV
jgi:phosphatidylinositol glycan class M